MNHALTIRPGELLSKHTAWRTGGACDVWVVAHDLPGVVEVVSDCRAADWKLTLIGAGTRSVVRDGPVSGAVLRLGTGFATMSFDEGVVGAACPLPALVAAAASAGRTGLEGFACGAGSVGASLLHDEGWDAIVASVSVLRRNHPIDVGLEEARRKRPIVLGVRLVLPVDDPAKVSRRTADQWGRQKPAPCSSWYESPKRGSLRKLLASARLPMVRLREVAIPEAAPELLVNLGEGTASDLLLLHRSALDRVARVQGEDLRSRIRWLGSTEEELGG